MYQEKEVYMNSSSFIDLGLGQTHLWSEFGPSCIQVEPFSNLYQLKPFDDPNRKELISKIVEWHKKNNNLYYQNFAVVFGLGSSQLISALVYSIVKHMISHPSSTHLYIVQQRPFYPFYQNLVKNAVQHLVKSIHFVDFVEKKQFNDFIIEMVCSPNNPDGKMMQSIQKNANVVVHDGAYDWPCYQSDSYYNSNWIQKSNTLVLSVYTFSKSLGLSGQRCGYAFVPPSLLSLTEEFITNQTLGLCSGGLSICFSFLKQVNIFHLQNKMEHLLIQRFDLLFELLNKKLHILSKRGTAYLWVYKFNTNLKNWFASKNINVLEGSLFGLSDEFARINLMAKQEDLNLFVQYIQ